MQRKATMLNIQYTHIHVYIRDG